jgi:lysophospholipase L1-like esterase
MTDFALKNGDTFVMIGDSITDCGRRDVAAPYGDGYVALTVDMARAACPAGGFTIVNKGIGGDNTRGLLERWDDDVIRYDPAWVSILIGINDQHTYMGDPVNGISPKVYRECYDAFLARTKEKTSARLIILDPFYISVAAAEGTWRRKVLDLIPEYIAVCGEMAAKYDAAHIATHAIYQEHLKYRDAEAYCPEPVHPNRAGHVVMAAEIIKALQGA